MLAIAKHRDAIGESSDFIQSVTDVNDRDAILTQLLQPLEQCLRLGDAQRCGRLVEDQQATTTIQCRRDLDHLLLTDAE